MPDAPRGDAALPADPYAQQSQSTLQRLRELAQQLAAERAAREATEKNYRELQDRANGYLAHIDLIEGKIRQAALDHGRKLLAEQKPAIPYLLYYPAMRAVCREHGYALAIHGSMNRDFDLVAIPWTEAASDPETLVAAICADNQLMDSARGDQAKPHGRRCWTLQGIAGVPHGWVDLSVMPRLAIDAARAAARGEVARG